MSYLYTVTHLWGNEQHWNNTHGCWYIDDFKISTAKNASVTANTTNIATTNVATGNSIFIFPTPANNMLKLILPDNNIQYLQIVNVMGKIYVETLLKGDEQVDVSYLSGGLALLNSETTLGKLKDLLNINHRRRDDYRWYKSKNNSKHHVSCKA